MPTIANPALLASDREAAFLEAACVPMDGSSHASGTLGEANAILANHPKVGTASIYTAAVLGDEVTVRNILAADAQQASAKGGPYHWDALTYLSFSRYLRLDPSRSEALARTATALLDAGADANTGWFEPVHQPTPVWESVIYGAAGCACHPELTRLLLERGADPNDDETPYHAAETYDLSTLKVLVESGKLNPTSLTTILLRKADWHDLEGFRYLLAHGADPNRVTRWQYTAFQFAVRRDNGIEIIDLLLDYHADPELTSGRDGRSGTAMAAWRGRSDVLKSIGKRGIPLNLQPLDQLIAACGNDQLAAIESITQVSPDLIQALIASGGSLLTEFAGNGNTSGVELLLDLGVDAAVRYEEGDAYFDVAKGSTALHNAAWRARPSTVKLLIERGTPIDALDGEGRTALMLAVRACVDSHWMSRRTPESVKLLLQAGASTHGVNYPSGYAEVDQLLYQAGMS